MNGKQLTFDDLVSSEPPPPKAQSKAESKADPFLIGAAALLNHWRVEKKTQKLALGILNGSQISTRNG
jgi:hypothetical protein